MSTGADAADDPEPTPATVGDAHPIFGQRRVTTAERFAWAGAYQRYDPLTIVHWGNRAKGPAAWAEAVNAFSRDPAVWNPERRHDIGQFHGVSLQARIDDTAIRIEPRHPYNRLGNYPAYTTTPGAVDIEHLAAWLHDQHRHATNELADLRTKHPTAAAHPNRLHTPNVER